MNKMGRRGNVVPSLGMLAIMEKLTEDQRKEILAVDLDQTMSSLRTTPASEESLRYRKRTVITSHSPIVRRYSGSR
jgi:hypothetical protein